MNSKLHGCISKLNSTSCVYFFLKKKRIDVHHHHRLHSFMDARKMLYANTAHMITATAHATYSVI
jgi:hypothetical protein